MPPAIVPVQGEMDLHKRTPFGPLGFADEVHAGFARRAVGFAGVAGDAGADNVFPTGRATPVARDDVVEVQVFSLESLAAILAGVVVALKDVVPREFDFFFGHPVVQEQQDDARHANAKGDGVNRFLRRRFVREIAPFLKIEGAERAVGMGQHRLGMALKEQRQRPAGGADVDRLPEPVQHEHMLVQPGFHKSTVKR